jgi:hypothetical protein
LEFAYRQAVPESLAERHEEGLRRYRRVISRHLDSAASKA